MSKSPEKAVTINNIVAFFEKEFSDIRSQCAWDNSGKQVYLGDHTITTVCLALDPQQKVIKQAVERGCELLITHHPLFFAPQKGINAENLKDSVVIEAIRNNLNILSYHTNLDMADDGLNTYLLRLLDADSLGILSPEGSHDYVKIMVFVPISHEQQVLDAMAGAGAGKMGNYSRCAYMSKGTGTFTPEEGSNPYIGEVGKAEYTEETRIETLVPYEKANSVITAMAAAHPYEHPAYDVIKVEKVSEFGSGKIGRLKNPLPFYEFLKLLKSKLSQDTININMEYTGKVEKFGICSGSGASLWKNCARKGINILVTGDLKHHDALDAREAGVCIIDVGHFASEQIYMNYLAKIIRDRFNVEVFIADETPPVKAWHG